MRPSLILTISGLILVGFTMSSASDDQALLQATAVDQFDLVGIGAESMSIEGGEIRLTGQPNGYLATKADYQDFELTFEFEYDRPADLKSDATFRGNSGVLIHVARPHKVWPDSIEVQLAQADPGALFALGEARFQGEANPLAQKKAIKPVGEWNQVRVTCTAGLITSVLNGFEVARGETSRTEKGPIGWQSQGKPIRFRALRIKSLD